MATGIRSTSVHIPASLESEAREKSGLTYVPMGALIRIGLAVMAGYSPQDATRLFFLDPTSKRAEKQREHSEH